MLSKLRGYSDFVIVPVARILAGFGISPNALTVLGFIGSVLAAAAFAYRELNYALFFLLITSLLDALDGAVARAANKTSKFGGFFDSVLDRYSDAFILMGLMLYLQKHYILIFIVLIGSILVSYSRARAELVIPKCDVGIAERAERLIILIATTFLEAFRIFPGIDVFYVALILLAVLTHATVLHRMIYTYLSLRR